MTDLELDPTLLETLRTLALHDVEFVLVGGLARAIYDHGGFVSGVEIVPGSYGRNAERLIAPLHSSASIACSAAMRRSALRP